MRSIRRTGGAYRLELADQHTRGSALIGWVKDDAEHIARQIEAFRPSAQGDARPPARVR